MQAFCAESLMSNSSLGRWIKEKGRESVQWKIEPFAFAAACDLLRRSLARDPDAGAEGKEVSDVSGDLCSVLGRCSVCFCCTFRSVAGQTMSGRRVWKS